MDRSHGDTPFPSSRPPDAAAASAYATESGMHAVVPTVALVVDDPVLLETLSSLLFRVGRVAAGQDIVPVAAAVVAADATAGARATVARIRARARADAAIVVILTGSAPDAELAAAYEAGAMLCLRAPVDERKLLAAIDSAIDLRTAKVRADDLERQLDVQSHLASLGRVTAGFTHEVASPLAALSATFTMLTEDVEELVQAAEILRAPGTREDDARGARARLGKVSLAGVREAMGDMQSALDHMRSVLSMVRGLAQAGRASVEDVDLADFVREVRRLAASEVHGVELQELVDERVVARADPRLLQQIVLNLIANAAHAARQLPSPRVRLHVYSAGEAAILSVRDNGPGVPEEIRDRIFEPFFTTRRGKGGTGLGLALCREYAAQMQGHISLWTAPGRGACFRIHLRR